MVTNTWLNYIAFWIESEILGKGANIQNRCKRNSLRIHHQKRLISTTQCVYKKLSKMLELDGKNRVCRAEA